MLIKLRAIGDVVLSTIAFSNLRRAFPEAKIDFLTEAASADVVQGNPYLDQIFLLDKHETHGWKALRRDIDFIQTIRHQGYNLVIDLFGNPRSALLTLLSGAQYRVGYAFRGRRFAYNLLVNPRGHLVHEAEFNLDALRRIGVPIIERELYFPLHQESLDFIDDFFEKGNLTDAFVVGINSSGGWPAKRWRQDYFAALADRLVREYNAKIILIWGPEELEEVTHLGSLMQEQYYLAPRTNLKELGALLKRCHLVISNDSGPMHISAAVGTPSVGIFGPTNPKLQGPYGESHEVAQKEELSCLGCNKLECENLDCMNLLSPDEVFKVVQRCVTKNKLIRNFGSLFGLFTR